MKVEWSSIHVFRFLSFSLNDRLHPVVLYGMFPQETRINPGVPRGSTLCIIWDKLMKLPRKMGVLIEYLKLFSEVII